MTGERHGSSHSRSGRLAKVAIGVVALVMAMVPLRASAQVQEALRAGATWRPNRPTAYAAAEPLPAPAAEASAVPVTEEAQPPARARRCSNGPVSRRLLVEPALGAVAGAIVGRVIFYTSAGGLLAADHGAEFKRARRNFTLGGATAGALLGLTRVAVVPTCPN